MNNSQIAHLWANQSKPFAKGSNFYFEGDTIYSYGRHFPIAKIINENLLFYTPRTYSSTTAQHKSLVFRAIDKSKFRVLEIPVFEKSQTNLDYFINLIAELHIDFKKSRKHKEAIKNKIEKTIEDYIFYCKFFKQKIDKKIVNFDLEKFQKQIEKNKKKHEKEAKIQAEKRRIENEIFEQKRLNKFLNYNEEIETVKWRRGTNFLRLEREKCITDCGAVVGIKDVKALCYLIQNKKEVVGLQVGDFTIDSFDEKGIKIGCHFFDTIEIQRIIKLFGEV